MGNNRTALVALTGLDRVAMGKSLLPSTVAEILTLPAIVELIALALSVRERCHE